MSGRRVTPDAQARASRIAAALEGLLDDEPPVPEAPRWVGDPYRGVPAEPVSFEPQFPCPGCGYALRPAYSRGVSIHRCLGCHGLWLDPGELAEMLGPHETLGEVDEGAVARRMAQVELPPRTVGYRPCPRCEQPMRRRNFADYSGVIVDLCPQHGVFLDPNEFEAIETFVVAGGMKLERSKLAAANRDRRARDPRRERFWWEVFF